MSKEKQIEEMARIIEKEDDSNIDGCEKDCNYGDDFYCIDCKYWKENRCLHHFNPAEAIYNAGYRKASEVAKLEQDVTRLEQEKDALIKNYAECMKDYAREIFEDIEKSIATIKYTVDSPRYTHIPIETMVEVCNWILQDCIPKRLAELKKKYIGEDINVTTKESEDTE